MQMFLKKLNLQSLSLASLRKSALWSSQGFVAVRYSPGVWSALVERRRLAMRTFSHRCDLPSQGFVSFSRCVIKTCLCVTKMEHACDAQPLVADCAREIRYKRLFAKRRGKDLRLNVDFQIDTLFSPGWKDWSAC